MTRPGADLCVPAACCRGCSESLTDQAQALDIRLLVEAKRALAAKIRTWRLPCPVWVDSQAFHGAPSEVGFYPAFEKRRPRSVLTDIRTYWNTVLGTRSVMRVVYHCQSLTLPLVGEMPVAHQLESFRTGDPRVRRTSDGPVRTGLDNVPCGAVWIQGVEAQFFRSSVIIGMYR